MPICQGKNKENSGLIIGSQSAAFDCFQSFELKSFGLIWQCLGGKTGHRDYRWDYSGTIGTRAHCIPSTQSRCQTKSKALAEYQKRLLC